MIRRIVASLPADGELPCVILLGMLCFLQPAVAEQVATGQVLPGQAAPGQVAAEQGAAVKDGRPRVGLVLSGGGARGAAHIGVLRVLEELRVPVDYIAGTSMGSIVGGLYASGMSPEQIEEALDSIDWEHIFSDRPPRIDRPFRRKQDDLYYLVKARPGFSEGEFKLPTGAIQGQKFELALRRLVLSASTTSDFDTLSIPYRAVASDIGTGEAVVLAGGDLAMAMRASMAVPGAFAATEIDGRLLVDGGITNNLPINVVRDMGADIVIAVDISTPLAAPEDVRNVLQITSQLTSIMTRANAEVQLASLKSTDILIVPDLGSIGTGDFKLAHQAVAIGHMAAAEKRESLARLSLPAADFNRHISARGRPPSGPPVVEFLRIVNNSRVAEEMIRHRIQQEIGQPLDTVGLEASIAAIYGLELFQTVRYDLIEESGRTGLEIAVNERSWGPDYLQFGIELSNNFSGDNHYNLRAAYIRTAINPLNGELRLGLQAGEEPMVGADWYQPLDFASRYFVESRARYQRQNFNVFDAGGALRTQYRVTSKGVELSAGRNLGVLAEARLGFRRYSGDIEVKIGAPNLPEGDFDNGSAFTRLSFDSLDNAYFPTRGGTATAEYEWFRDSLGNDDDLEQLKSQFGWFTTMGDHTIGLGGRYHSTLSGDAAVQNRFRMGGFLNLSGYPQDALSGQHSALATVMYYRRSTRLPFLPWYVGGSLELGNTWENRSEMSVDSAIASGSVFLGLDTPIGPLYVGYGRAEGGKEAAFMYLGSIF